MKLTEQSIGNEYQLMTPKNLSGKRRRYGIFRVDMVENGIASGSLSDNPLYYNWEPCKWLFNEDGHSVDELGKLCINGFVLEYI